MLLTITQNAYTKTAEEYKAEFDEKYEKIKVLYNKELYEIYETVFEEKMYQQAIVVLTKGLLFDPEHEKFKELLQQAEEKVKLYEENRSKKEFQIDPSDYRKELGKMKKLIIDAEKKAIKKFLSLLHVYRKRIDKEKHQELLEHLYTIDDDSENLRKAFGEKNVYPYGWLNIEDQKKVKKKYVRIDNTWIKERDLKRTGDKEHNKWGKAYEFESEHFLIRTDVPYKTLLETVDILEGYYKKFYDLIGTEMGMKEQNRLVFYYFAKRNNYENHARTCNLPSMHSGGYTGYPCKVMEMKKYKIEKENKVISHYVHDPNRVGDNLHNCVRHLVFGVKSTSGTPAYVKGNYSYFVHQGVVSYFETPKAAKMNKQLTKAKFRTMNKEYMPLQTFIAMRRFEFENTPGWNSNYYNVCQGTALVHYFMHSNKGKYRKPFVEFMHAVLSDSAGLNSFEEYMGAKPETFEADWIKYMKNISKQ